MEIKTLQKSLVFAAACGALSGCWVKTTVCRGLGNARPDSCKPSDDDDDGSSGGVVSGAQPTGSQPSTQTTVISTVVEGEGYALSRVVPEQLSNNVQTATNFGEEFRFADPYAGQTIDYILVLFGVPLGGVDFQNAMRRDPSTKAQTLLVARVIASELSGAAIGKEYQLGAGARVLFNKCDFESDRPYGAAGDDDLNATWQDAIKVGEARWKDQVDELFWRFYSRPPTAEELGAVRVAFLEAYAAEGWPPLAWRAILYAMLSSQEFWHI